MVCELRVRPLLFLARAGAAIGREEARQGLSVFQNEGLCEYGRSGKDDFIHQCERILIGICDS